MLVGDLDLGLQHLQLDDHVPKQLSAIGVAEAARIAELADLPEVMQDHAGEQQVVVDIGIMGRRKFRQVA